MTVGSIHNNKTDHYREFPDMMSSKFEIPGIKSFPPPHTMVSVVHPSKTLLLDVESNNVEILALNS